MIDLIVSVVSFVHWLVILSTVILGARFWYKASSGEQPVKKLSIVKIVSYVRERKLNRPIGVGWRHESKRSHQQFEYCRGFIMAADNEAWTFLKLKKYSKVYFFGLLLE